jgi:ABC-type glycerol-3-phosphate transport system permease component
MTATTVAAPTVVKSKRQPLLLRILPSVLWTLVAAVGSLIFILPLLWMASTAIKPLWEQMVMPPVWIPSTLEWKNFTVPWARYPFVSFYRTTLILVACNVSASLVSSSLVAYGFARLQFPGRNLLFLVLLSTMMLPGQVTLIPVYYVFTRLHWIDTLTPMIAPHLFASAFFVFLLRQFFMTISTELDDAAEIDGCGIFDVYWRIILPLSKPALTVVALMEFTRNWNDIFGPLIYLNTPRKFPIALGLRLVQTQYGTSPEVGQLMAMTLLSIIPVICVFYATQRYFIQGIVITGIKG